MKKFLLSIGLPLSLALVNPAMAFSFSDKPSQCPSAAAIQQAGLDLTVEDTSKGFWFSVALAEDYDTDDTWSFVIAEIEATSQEDAQSKAIKGLDSLQLAVGPIKGPLGKWICQYQTQEGYFAAAINPPIVGGFSSFINR